MATRFQSAGTFLADADQTNHVDDPSHVAALAGGGFVMVWDDIDRGLYGRVYDADGHAQGAIFSLAGRPYRPDGFSVAGLSSGGFAIGWVEAATGAPAQLKTQIFAPDGSPLGSAITVSSTNVSATGGAATAPLASGGFVILQETTFGRTIGHVFDSAGTATGTAFDVPSGGGSSGTVEAAPGGGFVLAWSVYVSFESGSDFYVRRFDDTGTPLGDPIAIATGPGSPIQQNVLVLASGAIVTTWAEGPGVDRDIYARIVAPDGSLGASFRVNAATAGDQIEPALTALADGGFLLAWQDAGRQAMDPFGTAIAAQRFDAAGSTVGEPFVLSGYKYGYQMRPDLATLADGTVVAVYTSTDNGFPSPLYGAAADLLDLVTPVASFGGEGNDSLTGTAAAEDISGLGGDDRIDGGAGDDLLVGGDGLDDLAGGTGNDRLEGGAGADRLDGGLGDDLLLGGDGDDTLVYAADERPAGTDRLEGGAGNDTFLASQADSERTPGALILDGGEGDDRFVLNWGSGILFGGPNLKIDAGAGADRVELLNGGGGADITLGDGADTLVLAGSYAGRVGSGLGAVIVSDFAPGAGDRLDIGDFLIRYLPGWDGATNPFADGHLKLEQQGTDTILRARYDPASDFTRLVTFRNVSVSAFTADSFGGLAPDGTPLPVHSLAGGDGADRLSGGIGVDLIDGLGGDDILHGCIGPDQLRGGEGSDQLFGEHGADRLEGGAGDDRLDGGVGDDRLDGGPGADAMEGFEGSDTYVVDNPGDYVSESFFLDHFFEDPGIDTILSSVSFSMPYGVERLILTGTAAIDGAGNFNDDYIEGNAAANRLTGDYGNDWLDGAGGDDILTGGRSNDTYVVDSFGDVVTELSSEGVDTVRTGLGAVGALYVLPDNVENLVGTAAGAQAVAGNALDNVLTMGGGNDMLDLSAGGNDTAIGNGGNDYFYFGATFSAADTVVGGAGTDTVALLGTYNLTLGANTLSGVETFSLLSGTAAGGTDHVTYSITTVDANVPAGGRLTVYAGGLLADESLFFNGYAETDGALSVYGGAGNDTFAGGPANDAFVGGAGNDVMYGLGGSDWMEGGLGADQMRGGLGGDLFVYKSAAESTAAATDRILDFEYVSDHISLSAIDANMGAAGDQAFTFIGGNAFSHNAGELRAYQSGSSWFVEGDVDGDGNADLVIQVDTFGGHALAAGDFLL
jgi:Ca2+-binding RTX toxin-like protein